MFARCLFAVIIFSQFTLVIGDGNFEVKENQGDGKLYVDLTYKMEMHDASLISDDDFQQNSLCQNDHPTFDCMDSAERVVVIRSSNFTTSVWRKTKFSNFPYAFNVSLANIQVGLEGSAAGDQLNVTLVCPNNQDVYVDGTSQLTSAFKLQYLKLSSDWLDALSAKFSQSVSFWCGGEDQVEISWTSAPLTSRVSTITVFVGVLSVIVVILLITVVVVVFKLRKINRDAYFQQSSIESERLMVDNPMSFSALRDERGEQSENTCDRFEGGKDHDGCRSKDTGLGHAENIYIST